MTINSLAAHVHQLVNSLSTACQGLGQQKVLVTPAAEVSPYDIWNELMDKI